MNSRPILIATCCALALVAFVYFLGKQHFSLDGTADQATRKPTSKPVTVNKSPTPNESFSPEASAIGDTNIPTERKDAALQRDTESTTDEAVRYTSGPYKGMTFEEANEYYKRRMRRSEFRRRLIEHADKEIALTDVLLKSVNDEQSVILSMFTLLSDEQLETARQELSKSFPADEVQTFFEDLANHSITKTPSEITAKAREIMTAREAYRIAHHQLGVEFEQLKKELEQLNKEDSNDD